MIPSLRTRFFAVVPFVLASCVVQKDPAQDFGTPPSIASFTLADGSSTLAPGDSIRVRWRVTNQETYHMRFFVSLDPTLDDSDHHLGGLNCGPLFEDLPSYDCSGIVCELRADPQGPSFVCGDPESPATYAVFVPTFLGGPEGQVTLIGEACNALFDACDQASLGLTFTAE